MSQNQLRQVLDSIFPASYLAARHPIGGCTLLELKCHESTTPSSTSNATNNHGNNHKPHHSCQVSGEPGSRNQVKALAKRLDDSLQSHRAKPTGLCSVRRAIYDQCFDEIIRQTTVNCLELGLLLVRIRNELRASLSSYEQAYQSAVCFGLGKALKSELEQDDYKHKMHQLELKETQTRRLLERGNQNDELKDRNELDSAQRIRSYLNKELAKRDQIIQQQRAIIKSLSQDII